VAAARSATWRSPRRWSYVTGGAQSAYTFFYALTVIGATSVTDRRGAVLVAGLATALLIAVSTSAWARVVPLPTVPQVEPWTQTGRELIVTLGRNVGALAAAGVLGSLVAGELHATQASLATQRQVVADLVALNRDIVRSLTSGLVTIDRTDTVLTLNQTAAEILGPVAAGVDRRARSRPDACRGWGRGWPASAPPPTARLRRIDVTLAAAAAAGPSACRCRRCATTATR
jgi:hypothetical protein